MKGRTSGALSRLGLLRRALGMVGGYYLHRWVVLWLGAFDGVAAVVPTGLPWLLPIFAVAAVLAGYLASLIAGGSTRTARLLGIALAAIAILAALQRVEQGLPLLSRQVAQILTSPLCAAGAALSARHRRLLDDTGRA